WIEKLQSALDQADSVPSSIRAQDQNINFQELGFEDIAAHSLRIINEQEGEYVTVNRNFLVRLSALTLSLTKDQLDIATFTTSSLSALDKISTSLQALTNNNLEIKAGIADLKNSDELQKTNPCRCLHKGVHNRNETHP